MCDLWLPPDIKGLTLPYIIVFKICNIIHSISAEKRKMIIRRGPNKCGEWVGLRRKVRVGNSSEKKWMGCLFGTGGVLHIVKNLKDEHTKAWACFFYQLPKCKY